MTLHEKEVARHYKEFVCAMAERPDGIGELAREWLKNGRQKEKDADTHIPTPREVYDEAVNSQLERCRVAAEPAPGEAEQQEWKRFAADYVSANAGWIYETDSLGQVRKNPDSSGVMTPAGKRFTERTKLLVRKGILDPRIQISILQKAMLSDLEFLKRGESPPDLKDE